MKEITAAVSISVQAFLNAAVDEWFAICEAQFQLGFNEWEHKLLSYLVVFASRSCYIQPTIIASKEYAWPKDAVVKRHEGMQSEISEKFIASSQITDRPSVYLQDFRLTANEVCVGS